MPQALPFIIAGVSAASSINQGQVAQAQAKNNAILSGFQADETLRAGVANQNLARRQVRQFIGKQRAIVGASGAQNLGSPLALQEDAAALGEEDIANIRNQAALDAYGLKIGAKDALYRGQSAAATANANAFSSLAGAYNSKDFAKIGSAIGKIGKRTPNYSDSPILTGDKYYG